MGPIDFHIEFVMDMHRYPLWFLCVVAAAHVGMKLHKAFK